jgi:Protein of unknown function (DUF3703)
VPVLFQRMPDTVRTAFDAEMSMAHEAADLELAWRSLERAHVLSQPWPWPHARTHLTMLTLALRTRDAREALVQAARILVAAPGSAAGRYPHGSTGRARVPMMRPMPVQADLAAILNGAHP